MKQNTLLWLLVPETEEDEPRRDPGKNGRDKAPDYHKDGRDHDVP